MVVYIYDKKTNKKVETVKDVYRVASCDTHFRLYTPDGITPVDKQGIKLVVYGF